MTSRKSGCQAKRYADEMQCAICGTTWDVNDPDPPECIKECEVCGRINVTVHGGTCDKCFYDKMDEDE